MEARMRTDEAMAVQRLANGLAGELGHKDAEIVKLRAENANLRAAMDSIRAIVLAARDLEQQ